MVTYGGRVHDLRIAEATPYPLPAGSGLLQDLGFLSFTLPEVAILMPTKKPRGAELSLEQQLANQVLNQRRLRIEHVNSSVKRCRIVKDRIRLWKQGVRDLVMELCCARVSSSPRGCFMGMRISTSGSVNARKPRSCNNRLWVGKG